MSNVEDFHYVEQRKETLAERARAEKAEARVLELEQEIVRTKSQYQKDLERFLQMVEEAKTDFGKRLEQAHAEIEVTAHRLIIETLRQATNVVVEALTLDSARDALKSMQTEFEAKFQ